MVELLDHVFTLEVVLPEITPWLLNPKFLKKPKYFEPNLLPNKRSVQARFLALLAYTETILTKSNQFQRLKNGIFERYQNLILRQIILLYIDNTSLILPAISIWWNTPQSMLLSMQILWNERQE